MGQPKVVLFANTDWYLYNFRASLAWRLRNDGFEVILLSPDGEYGPKLREQGFRWHAVPMKRRSLNPLREAALVMWLARFLHREQVSVIHGFTIKCAAYGSLAGRLAGVSARVSAVAGMGYVFTSSDMTARALRPVVRAVLRLALNGRGSALILQNPDDVALFEATGIVDPCSIRLIKGSGVNLSRFTLRAEPEQRAGRPLRVLLAARLLWDKGIAEYVDAARALKQEGRTLRCQLAGLPDDGNPAAVERKQLEAWVNEGLIEWLGHVIDMPRLLSETDVMVLPSYREGLPKALIEAAACGVALVTTDAPGCREVVSKTGDDGISVPVRDSRALAQAIRLLDGDRVLCRKLGLAAREKALVQFDEQIIIDKTLAVYRELMPAYPRDLGGRADGVTYPVKIS
ncbi:glycosyltransferase [Paraburkholderia sp. CNPSo 3157]|uniref:Glycosyltransferase n=1 Tax=Paraburkholderia franconis TaxID=2654983 RepID=A0A7X1N9E6_9BURK|nr:glycosyltransferase family 4 protein [Paraburkholderia franconis]MPW17421.1 glycosyltransferase [Paraburkholderia franconis]